VQGSLSHEPKLYLSVYEAQAMTWLKSNSRVESVILASPETGAFLPAQTGCYVFYGHPFETVNAIKMKAEVEAAFRDPTPWNSALFARSDFIFFGPRERNLGADYFASGLPIVFEAGDVRVYLADLAIAQR
jgi:hypothetical protein